MRVLVTGATGFIGGHLVCRLCTSGYAVRALVRSRSPELERLGVEQVVGDVTRPPTLAAAVTGVRAVFHLAAVRDQWGTPPELYHAVNVGGTRNVLAAARQAQVKRVVYCSSVGVARYAGNLEADETLPICRPTSQVFYHRTKAQAELMATGAQAVVVRPVIAYGPQDASGFVTRLLKLLERGQVFWVGDGRNHVDLVYIDDLADGMCRALERGAEGRVYILSSPAPIRVEVLIGEICELVGRPTPRFRLPASLARLVGWGMEALYGAGARLRIVTDGKEPFITRDKVATLTVDRGFSHARAKRELGYRPRVRYDEGLRRTLAWMRAAGSIEP
jgi:nucleoside-diphosphate-sugar epimerase